ncbi:MAG: transcription termination factor Rho [Paraglaciecola sp.]|uniref:transcription termination factor Rho n=1 Tax=Paraglaciecola sp. TaxID=1920173 RepID=UPI00329690F0
MAREILSLNLKRKKASKPADSQVNKHDVNPSPTKQPVEDPQSRFLKGTAVNPYECIQLSLSSNEPTMRAMDMFTPIGKGQRGLIVAPPGCGKTTMLKHICQAVGAGHPEIKLYALLIDERPEEVTDFTRSVPATVHASSTDESYAHHVQVANNLLNIARKEAGEGHDVMIVIDSLTRLTRVHNAKQKSSGRTMSGGLDAKAMEMPRKLFGSARKVEDSGSLTILATVLADTGSRMDQVIFEEFKGTGNMEVVLSREAASQRVFPALDISKSSTRREELLLAPKTLPNIRALRRGLTGLKPVDGAKKLVELLNNYPTNAELLHR